MQSLRTQFIETYLAEKPKQFSKHGLELAIAHLEHEKQIYLGHETVSVMYDNISTFTEVDYEDFFNKKRHDGSFSEDILNYDNNDLTDTEIMWVVTQHLKSQNAFVGFTYNHTVVYDTKKSPRALFIKTFLASHNSENNLFSEEGLNVLIKYLDEDQDGAEPEKNTDEVLVERIVGWYSEDEYDTLFYDEVASGNIQDIDPSDYEVDLDDTEYDKAIRNAVQRLLTAKHIFVGFTTKRTVVYCSGNYHNN